MTFQKMQAALFALLPALAGRRQVMMMLQHPDAMLSWELTNETAALQPCTWERGRLCVAVRVERCDRGVCSDDIGTPCRPHCLERLQLQPGFHLISAESRQMGLLVQARLRCIC